jgi:hypothetical protein
MYTKVADKTLRTGEPVELGIVLAPDAEHAGQIKPFLAHKGGLWNWQVEKSLQEPLDLLETRYHVCKLHGQIIANVMTVEYGRTGILGHVFTKPEQRRKGACDLVMDVTMNHFRERGGGVLLLGTGFQSPAYWIYYRFGFRSVLEGAGFMRFASDEDFETKHFVACDARVRDVVWHDWPRLGLLLSRREGDCLKVLSMGARGQANFEHGFLSLRKAMADSPACRARVLESEKGAVIGLALVQPDPRWFGAVSILDLYVHPSFASCSSRLLRELPLPPGKTQCYAESGARAKLQALRACGFTREATLKKQFDRWGKRVNVSVFAKSR